MKRAKYYLSVICLLLIIVNCAVDGGNGKNQEEEEIVLTQIEIGSIEKLNNYTPWPLNGSVVNNSNYNVLCWDDGTYETHITNPNGIP